MTKEQKVQEIQDLTKVILGKKSLFDRYCGLDAVQTTALRRACFKANIKLSVVKNTYWRKPWRPLTKILGT